MNFIKRFFFSKKDNERINSDWNKKINEAYKSVNDDRLEYPVILFSHVLWDFSIYNNPTELIRESISGHWGFNEYFASESKELDLVIDSKGNSFKLNHEHYDKITDIDFSYPSKFLKTEAIGSIKERIIIGCKNYIEFYSEKSKEKKVETKIEILKKMNSISELIKYADEELYFYK